MKFSNLYSHPDKYLEIHLNNTLQIALKFLNNDKIENNDLKDVLKIITLFHDIGKSTVFFQKYISGSQSVKHLLETNHSLLSGIIAYYLLKSRKIDPFLLLASFILVKRHHSDLRDFKDEVLFDDREIEILKKQLKSIDKDSFKILLQNLGFSEVLNLNRLNIVEIVSEIKKLRKFLRKISKEKSLFYYVITILLFSYLLDSDKSDAGLKIDYDFLFNKFDLPEDIVDIFLKRRKHKETKINQLRMRAYSEALSFPINNVYKIYSLNLPTGMGKTLISFAFALKLANKVNANRIIYCLPFLSIIEQNFDVFKKVLEANELSIDTFTILKHHHLSDFQYKFEENEFDFESSRILIEGWHSKIVVSTFVQFFYTLIGFKNKNLRKFHNLVNSVIILDEIQSIPFKYWLVIKELFTYLVENYNVYIIFATATQPLIFEENEIQPILDSSKYFDFFNRYRIHVDKSPKSIQAFLNDIKIDENKRYLFIANTIDEAKIIYKHLKRYKPAFLSTQIVPAERIKRINEIRVKKYKLVVSTQLVEAGVDIDFDIVYRDFAPLDSIIQSAGRCNREGLFNIGEVFVFKLADRNNRLYSSYIYDSVLLEATAKILNKKLIYEREVSNLVNEYYREISKIKSRKDSYDLLEHLYALRFYGEKDNNKINSIADFVLIEDDLYKSSVFIEIDENASELWQEFVRIKEIKDIFERRKEFYKIKRDFYNYVINAQVNYNTPPYKDGFYYVGKEMLESFYDPETGFIDGKETKLFI